MRAIVLNLPSVFVSISPFDLPVVSVVDGDMGRVVFQDIATNCGFGIHPFPLVRDRISNVLPLPRGLVVRDIALIIISILEYVSPLPLCNTLLEISLKVLLIRKQYPSHSFWQIILPCPIIDEVHHCLPLWLSQLHLPLW